MIRKILLLFFIFFAIHSVCAENIDLPYTDISNVSTFSMYDVSNNNISVYANNQIYCIDKRYNFKRTSLLSLEHGTYYNNISFQHEYINTTISEQFIISNAFLSKKVKYTLNTFENDILSNTKVNTYYVFSTTNNFAKTKIKFIDNEISIEHKYTDIHGYNTLNYQLTIDKQLILTNCILDNTIYITHYSIEYVILGIKPKSYYVNKLNPILQLPYTIISGFDDNNTILNILIITSYLLSIILFWIKVIYQSFFILLFLILVGVIPFISYTQSTNPKDFITELFNNYNKFFNIIINFIKYIIELIITLIGLLPFI